MRGPGESHAMRRAIIKRTGVATIKMRDPTSKSRRRVIMVLSWRDERQNHERLPRSRFFRWHEQHVAVQEICCSRGLPAALASDTHSELVPLSAFPLVGPAPGYLLPSMHVRLLSL